MAHVAYKSLKPYGAYAICAVLLLSITYSDSQIQLQLVDKRDVYVLNFPAGGQFSLDHGETKQFSVSVYPPDQLLSFTVDDPRVRVSADSTGATRIVTVTDLTTPSDEESGPNELILHVNLPDGTPALTPFDTPADFDYGGLVETAPEKVGRRVSQFISTELHPAMKAAATLGGNLALAKAQEDAQHEGESLSPDDSSAYTQNLNINGSALYDNLAAILSDATTKIWQSDPSYSALESKTLLRPTSPEAPPNSNVTFSFVPGPITVNCANNGENQCTPLWKSYVRAPLTFFADPKNVQVTGTASISPSNVYIYKVQMSAAYSIQNAFGGSPIIDGSAIYLNQLKIGVSIQINLEPLWTPK